MLPLALPLRRPLATAGIHFSAVLRDAQLPPATSVPTPDGPPTARGGFPKKRVVSALDAPAYGIHCKSSRNNTIVSVTLDKNVLKWWSGGSCKFKGANRSSYEAGYQCAKSSFLYMAERIKQDSNASITVYFNGFGQGREAMRSALLAVEGQPIRDYIRSVTDCTPIKIGGTRAKKARRL